MAVSDSAPEIELVFHRAHDPFNEPFEKEEVIATVDTLQKQGLNPNSLVLLPDWNSLAGH